MKNIDNIIEQIRRGIKQQEFLITKENPNTKEGCKNIECYKRKIAELEYRILELEEKKKNNQSIIAPKYGDGKYANNEHKEALDMLRVCYYNYFQHDPLFSPVPKWDVMFYDPTLWLPVDTYLVRGNIPFQIMFRDNYPNHNSDNTKSVSIELPFEVLSKEENENYLRCMLELIRIYSGDSVNLIIGSEVSTRGTLSFIADKDLSMYSRKEINYYKFFEELCDNNVRNIIYIGDSIKKDVEPETINRVQSEIIDLHKKLTAREGITEEELEKSNVKVKQHVLSINNLISNCL